jgi:hypothetical protein
LKTVLTTGTDSRRGHSGAVEERKNRCQFFLFVAFLHSKNEMTPIFSPAARRLREGQSHREALRMTHLQLEMDTDHDQY